MLTPSSWNAPPGYRFPVPPFPNGWFQVAYSDELTGGGVLPLHYFGRHLVLFRGKDGLARVLDAHCPHLGAHLGHGGTVQEDCIRCPFHAWRFDGVGSCVEIPYAKKIPPAARIRAWHVREANGLIMVWHHADGREPEWELPEVPECGSQEWTGFVRRRWKIRSHNQEMAENAVDAAHFKYVHGAGEPFASRIEAEGPHMRVRSEVIYPEAMGSVRGVLTSDSWGFGFSTSRFTGIVETLLIGNVTPIDGEFVDVRFTFVVRRLADDSMTEMVGNGFIAEVERQLGQDIPIWEHKVMLPRPLLCDGDGPIGVFRRWARQFYAPFSS
jgi:nitrite reductase/ring-hydroxylating ferredoxin subunit